MNMNNKPKNKLAPIAIYKPVFANRGWCIISF